MKILENYASHKRNEVEEHIYRLNKQFPITISIVCWAVIDVFSKSFMTL